MANPFGDAEHTNPFGDTEVENPFGDKPHVPVAKTNLLSSEGVSSIARGIVPNIKQGLKGLELAKLENPPLPVGIKHPYMQTPEEKEAEISQVRADLQTGAANIKRLAPENPSYPLQIATGATNSIAQNAPGILGAVAMRNLAPVTQAILPAVGLSTAQARGQVYAENRTPDEQGNTKVSQQDAFKNAATQSAIEGSLGAMPVAGLLKDLGKETFAKTVGKFILREEVTEIPTAIWQKISDRVYANPNQPINEFLKEMGSDVLDTALITPFAAGGTAAIASGAAAAQDTLFARKEHDKAATLAKIKGDLMADLQKKTVEAQSGLDEESLMAAKIETGPQHKPTAPLTPEEDKLADIQLKNMKSGAADTPANPVAQADTADFDKILADPVYQQPEDVEAKKEVQIELDVDKGMSREVAERRANEIYPTALPPTQRPIAWSTNASHVGLNLQQAAVGAGDVIVLGGNEEQFSPAYTKALGETISAWSKQFMPEDSRIVLNLSGLKGEAVGGYQQSGSGIHIITPRELVRTQRGESPSPEGVTLGDLPITGYNVFTQAQTFGALTHEFGHALVMSSFATAMPKAYRNVIGQLDTGKVYQEADLAKMPVPEAAVIREYQAMKLAVLNGSMTAEELVEKWLGTWKVGKDLSKQQGKDLYSFAKSALLREAKIQRDSSLSSLPLSQIPALTLVHAMGRNANVETEISNTEAENYYLQFNEYMAEQFSRYAHSNKLNEGTALGVYFKRALQSLRSLFKMLKTTKGEDGELIIKPGTSFQSWVDGMAEAKAVRLAKKEAKRTKPKSTRKPRTLKPKVVPDIEDLPEVVAARQEDKEEVAGEGNTTNPLEELAEDPLTKELLKERVRQMFPDIKNDTRAEMMQMISRGELLEVEDQLADIANDQVKKDVGESAPFLDKTSGDAQEVEKVLNRMGVKDTTIWKKAIDFTKNAKYYLLQIQQLAHTSNDMGLNMFNSYQTKLMAQKNQMLKEGTEVAEQWENLGKEDSSLIEKILQDEFHSGGHMTELTRDANGKWSHIGGIAFVDYAKSRGLDVTTPNGEVLGALILRIKNSMLNHIQIIEDVAIQHAKEKYAKAELMQRRREHQIREIAHKWRTVPFVPQGHYGNYIVKVFERNEDGKKVLAYQGHFETAAEQDVAVKNFQKKGIDLANIRWMKIKDKTGVQLTLPKDFLETLEDTGEFTSDQLRDIGDAMMPLRDEKAFSKFARDASKIAGASPDVLKNYANWIEDSANAVSKMTWGRRMTGARAFTRSDMVDLKTAGDVEGAREKQRILDTMEKAQQFMLHPMEEYYQTRSIVSLTFLMYSVKTALMNATGLLQSVAALTADYGDAAGARLFGGAIKSLMEGKFSVDEMYIRNKALEDGIIDQGFGYFMSGLANAGNLQRRIRPTVYGKAARMFVDTGMYLFKAVETGNRNVTLLALYRAERQRYLAQKEEDGTPRYTLNQAMEYAYTQAANKTRLLQNDYASGNRPEALRGKKSLFMIFLSYPQYMLWIMSGGYERGVRAEQKARGQTPRSVLAGTTARMWLLFLALAGTEGVPFGETILELVQKLWHMFGKGDNIRVEGQRFLKDAAGIESRYWRNVIQRGFLHDVLGADLSGSYSLGKPLPGLGLINPQSDNWKEFVGEAFAELSGPFGGFVKGGLELGLSESIDEKELGKNLPGAAGAIVRAMEAGEHGVKSARGERILRDENGNLRKPTAAEIAAIGAGFRLTEVAQFQQIERLKKQSADYWNGRRIGLKHSYKKAVDDRDPQAREDILKSVTEYNSEIPDRGLRLTGKELREYVRTFNKNVRRLESDRDPKRVRGLHRDVAQVFSE